ncbi:polysaccharide deacetylase family protein [Burkholderia multivorans]|uniref:polysaccharide deacetylase family protein n=1 Tax=Burkholderia multivorans TaxID=87883 RepID=UPI000CFFB819|nr:polysaccharide deacetylase family protein [Burkholderia multivorans]PRE16995.1 polysaccharide deacetylase [Burkholderia multivorans]PRG18887.1 polysaccharide deacetylase [Burkholderia multivorans]
MAFRAILISLLLAACTSAASSSVSSADDVAPVRQRVLILVYHRFAEQRVDSMTVRIHTFIEQLRVIDAHGYRIVPLADVVRWHRGRTDAVPARAVAITVDDGHRSVYRILRPLLIAHPMPVTLFVYPSAISNASYAMTWDQVRALVGSANVDVESHTYWHPNFDVERAHRSPDDFRRFASDQLARSRARLESETGKPVRLLAWPFGIHDAEVERIAAQHGYVAAFTLDARAVRRTDRAMALPRYLMTDACDARCMARMLDAVEAER